MKSIILVLLILFIYNISFSQPEFAPIGAEWHYGYREGVQTPATGYYYIKSVKDTAIDNKVCKVLHKWLTYSNGNTVFEGADYLYSDTAEQKVYRYLFEKFYLLYDFSKEKGDTLTILEPYSATENDSIQLVVDSVRFETFSDSIQLKTLFTHAIYRSDLALSFPGKMTEKIGNEYFIFPFNGLDCDGGCPQPLRCYSDEKVASYKYLPCDYLYSNIEKLCYIDNINIYPNPFKESFIIEYKNSIYLKYINIKNMEGKSIYSNSDLSFPIQINLSNIPEGMYFICFTSAKDTIYRKIIKL